ncbi:uncharacterized protein LOC119660168 [Hermetia illucens]|uniref:uncharacterized protein LOC119660168 n=1 Tax=Hermetia illucens TaxID=343691 RepID=UPI0018CBF1FD|nr:uncharacterized protein LOC119660168 [Hermetia illucens]
MLTWSYSFTILLSCSALLLTRRTCLRVEFNALRSGQNSEYVKINTAWINESGIMMYIDILQSCVNPTWTIGLSKHNNIRGSTIMFNASSRTCDLERFSIRNQFAKAFKAVAYQMTNFSLICPLPAGRYMIGPRMDRIKNIFPLRLFYQPNTITSIHMRFYDQVPKGNFTFWAELLFIGQVRIDC